MRAGGFDLGAELTERVLLLIFPSERRAMACVCQLWRAVVCHHQTMLTAALPPGGLAPAARHGLLSAAARRPNIRRLTVAAHDRFCLDTLLLLLHLMPNLSWLELEDRSSSGDSGRMEIQMPELPQSCIANLLARLATLRLAYPARLPASIGALTSLVRLQLQQRSPSRLDLPTALSGLRQLSLLRAAGDLNGTGAAELGRCAVLAGLPALRRLEFQCLRLTQLTWLQAVTQLVALDWHMVGSRSTAADGDLGSLPEAELDMALGRLTGLEELSLRWNGLRNLPPAVAALSRLQRLGYAANRALLGLPRGAWQSSLRSLDLAGVDGLHLGHLLPVLQHMRRLEALQLDMDAVLAPGQLQLLARPALPATLRCLRLQPGQEHSTVPAHVLQALRRQLPGVDLVVLAYVLGVVILHAGKRSAAADDLLLSVASMYGRVTRREVVAVANTATLEAAVRGCMEDGATKVMVVPYCTSLEFQPDANPALALAEVQSRMPGISCMMGDTIAVDALLAEFIEGQVRVVEGKRAAVPERCFEPGQRPARQAAPAGDSLHTSSGLPQAEERQAGSSASAASSSAGPGAWSDDLGSVLVVDYRETNEAAPDSSAVAAEPAARVRSGIVGSSFDLVDEAGASSFDLVDEAGASSFDLVDEAGASSFDLVDEAGASSGEADWGSHRTGQSGYTGRGSDVDSDSEDGSGSADGGGGDSIESSASESRSSECAGQPVYEEALELRLSRMEQQLQHITTLLQAPLPAQQVQQVQQAQQPPTWQSAMFEQQAPELVEVEGEATLYSPQQLAFLARKRAAKRARTGRP